MSGLAISSAIVAVGVAAAWGWAAWRMVAETARWRGLFAAMVIVIPVGIGTMAMGRTAAQIAAGLALILISLGALMGYRGPGRLFSIVVLVFAVALAAGTPWPWR